MVYNVYPLEGNETVVGYDLLGPGAGNREAARSRELRDLVFGGPFQMVQGGMALVGRLPVYVGEEERFWGLVSVTLKYPEALAAVGLDTLEQRGLAYELWRMNPDTGTRQIIAHSAYKYSENTGYIEKHIRILNADWYCRILPVRPWYQYPENWAMIAGGLLISLLVSGIVQRNYDLRLVKTELEDMLCTDSLTGIFNRVGLFCELDRLVRHRRRFRLWYMDLNYFKQTNDVFGHTVGNMMLIAFTRRIQSFTNDSQIFGRMGGDEFIIVCTDMETRDGEFWRRIDQVGEEPLMEVDAERIMLSFSKGIAVCPEDGDAVDALVTRADRRMYKAKNARYSVERRRRAGDVPRLPDRAAHVDAVSAESRAL